MTERSLNPNLYDFEEAILAAGRVIEVLAKNVPNEYRPSIAIQNDINTVIWLEALIRGKRGIPL